MALSALQKTLGHTFRSPEMLQLALTHPSAETHTNYERLEFLGDRVLGIVMADLLYNTFPEESEGDLAKRHAALVQGTTIAKIAQAIDLGACIEMSEAERTAGGEENENILADVMEAVIGALYLDAGLEPCRDMIRRLWGDTIHTMTEPPQDPKTALQEWAQGRGLPLPVYEIVSREGPDHAPVFEIRVTVEGYPPVTAKGPSRRAAEKEAATLLVDHLPKAG